MGAAVTPSKHRRIRAACCAARRALLAGAALRVHLAGDGSKAEGNDGDCKKVRFDEDDKNAVDGYAYQGICADAAGKQCEEQCKEIQYVEKYVVVEVPQIQYVVNYVELEQERRILQETQDELQAVLTELSQKRRPALENAAAEAARLSEEERVAKQAAAAVAKQAVEERLAQKTAAAEAARLAEEERVAKQAAQAAKQAEEERLVLENAAAGREAEVERSSAELADALNSMADEAGEMEAWSFMSQLEWAVRALNGEDYAEEAIAHLDDAIKYAVRRKGTASDDEWDFIDVDTLMAARRTIADKQ